MNKDNFPALLFHNALIRESFSGRVGSTSINCEIIEEQGRSLKTTKSTSVKGTVLVISSVACPIHNVTL